MGEVWLADHLELGVRVAVKFPDLAAVPDAGRRFKQEIAMAGAVASPHVVKLLDHGMSDEGIPFMVMEHLEGRSLKAHLAASGPLTLWETARLVAQVGSALDCAHQAGVMHRDIKPENIFVLETGREFRVKVVDLGAARRQNALRETSPGMVVGSPAYVSRDVLVSEGNDLDSGVDRWALGVTAYKCLTGQLPFQGGSIAAVCGAIIDGLMAKPSRLRMDVSPALDRWFAQVFCHEPAIRPGSGVEMAESFAAACDLQPDSDASPRRGRVIAAAVAATAALAAVGGVALVLAAQRPVQHAAMPGLQGVEEAVHVAPSELGLANLAAIELPGASFWRQLSSVAPPRAPEALRIEMARQRLLIDAGPFWMGCAPKDWECEPDERPGARVVLPAFYLDRHEVTVSAYERCVGDGACGAEQLASEFRDGVEPQPSSQCNYPRRGHKSHPINCLSHGQAAAYCEWAGARLPSEAEWEKAARGPNPQRFPWAGHYATCRHAVMTSGPHGCRAAGSWPVGRKLGGASPFGALDMAGNVREWVSGRYRTYPLSAEQASSKTRWMRVARGGGWADTAGRQLRASQRLALHAETRASDLGFRCAHSPGPTAASDSEPSATAPQGPASAR